MSRDLELGGLVSCG